MGARIKCFFLEPAPWAEESFRRFTWSNETKCPGPAGYHTVSVVVSPKVPWDKEHNGEGNLAEKELRKDPRWPEKCVCGYVFTPEDQWQHNFDRLYTRSDNSELVTLRSAPVGAMWDAHWMSDRYKGPDGLHLIVKTPGGDWPVDGPSSGGGKWTREGKVPNITAKPSILFPPTTTTDGRVLEKGYHGFLTNGFLEEC